MTTTSAGRFGLGAGLISAVAFFVGVGVLGDTPDTRDSTQQIASYFVRHRTSVFVGAVFLGVGVVALLVFASALGSWLDDARSPVAARLAPGSAAVVGSVVVVGLALVYASLAYVIGSDVPEMAKGLFELTLVATPVAALPMAAFVASTISSMWPRRAGPRWLAGLSALEVVVLTVAASSYAEHGPASPDVQQQVVYTSFIIWLAVASVTTMRWSRRRR